MTSRPAGTTAIAGQRVHQHLLVRRRVAHGSELALANANLAAIARIEVHPGDMFATEHVFKITPLVRDTVSHAVLVAIAQTADIGGFKRPHRMHQPFYVQLVDRRTRLIAGQPFQALSAVAYALEGNRTSIAGSAILRPIR